MKLQELFADKRRRSSGRRERCRLSEDTRSATSVLSNVLMIAVAVVLAAVLGTFAFTFLTDTNSSPTASFETEYEEETGKLVLRHSSGDPLEKENLRIKGGNGDVEYTEDGRIESGDTLRYQAQPGDTVTINWDGSTETTTLFETKVPDDLSTDTYLSWDREIEQHTIGEFFGWVNVDEDGMTKREKPDHVDVADDGAGEATYTVTTPNDADTVTVDFHFEGKSYEGSGMELVVVSQSGEKQLACEPGGAITCSGNPSNNGPIFTAQSGDFTIDQTFTSSPGGDIEKVFVRLDMVNTDGKFYDESEFYHWDVTTDS